MNFDTKKINTIHKFKTALSDQPEFFCVNEKQNVYIVASPDDGIYYNGKKNKEEDLDELFNIGKIKSAIFDFKDASFYIMTNVYEGQYGVFLIQFS